MLKKIISVAMSVLVLGSLSLVAAAEEVVYDKPADAQIYADFDTPFDSDGWESTPVASGNGDNTIQLVVVEGASTAYSTVDGALKVEFKSTDSDPFVRFQNQLCMAEDQSGSIVAAYDYMVVRMKGEADEGISVNGGPGQGGLAFAFGGAGNMFNGVTFRSDGYTGQAAAGKTPEGDALAEITNEYQTFVIKMEDSYFSGMGAAGDGTMMFIRSIGAFNKTIYIDEIYFTDSVPQEASEFSDNNEIPEDAIYIEDGRRDEFLLPFGDVKINYANGANASFINEVAINDDTAADAFTLSDGILTFKSAADGYGNYSLGENYYVNYDYMVFRIRSTDGSDGSKFSVRLGSFAATEVMFDKLQFDEDNYVKPITDEWQDIYVSTADFNGLNGQPYLKLHGKSEGTFEIDCIYMTDTVPEGYVAGEEIETPPATTTTEDETTDTTSSQDDEDTTTTTQTSDESPKTGSPLPVVMIILALTAAVALVTVSGKKARSF